MFLRELSASVDIIKGAGPAAVKTLAKAGVYNVAGLLTRYPRDYEDRSISVLLKDYFRYPAVCTIVKILGHNWIGAGRMKTLKIYVEDESARAVLVCFNRPFLEKQIHIGKYYRLWGKFFYKYGEIQSTAFELEAFNEHSDETQTMQGFAKSKSFGDIFPVYPLTANLTQNLLQTLIRNALNQYGKNLEDELPHDIRDREILMPKSDAIHAIHFPETFNQLESAKKRIKYEELFYLEVMVGKRALERKSYMIHAAELGKPSAALREKKSGAVQFSSLQKRLMERLPFTLTAGQILAAEEINLDMDGSYPMARLLQGDVGSGKTLVSFLAALKAVDSGMQAAIMAPTELLARQHAESAAKLLEPLGIRPAFLTGNLKAAGRNHLLKALAAGEIDIVVGTHALFSKDVAYKNLGLIVVDEQHRFGVVQRSAIMAKGDHPHLLMMSATPIPRTLALTVFGDMDVSVIRDMPPGRKAIRTHLANQKSEQRVYDFVRQELVKGHQAYFVYPLIENYEGKDLKDAESMAEHLAKEIFPKYHIALIHSKLDDEEKRTTMESFRQGNIQILAATSVVEVGVDVPNATCMIIEHAERFGLSALHQLRGRVGRGKDQSYCFLKYSDSLTEDGKTRLKVMLENTDGFIIAEEDLKLRGPGRISGIEQSGYLKLGLADPIADADVLVRARSDAFHILENDQGFLQPENRMIDEVLRRAPPFSSVIL
ncbi:MAG: ATP-dependent DNA helicase RecG [Treponema sp.]|nr:ATP-dependent DNA helicase RecG [Treponema sp.]